MNIQEHIDAICRRSEYWTGKNIGIAYTQVTSGDRDSIWYDRLGTDILAFCSMGFSELKSEFIFLTVDQLGKEAFDGTLGENYDLILNCCLGHRSISNWALIPSLSTWSNAKIAPAPTQAIILGEDKLLSKDAARSAGLHIPETSTLASSTKSVIKPRYLGSSVGVEFRHEPPPKLRDKSRISENFVAGHDLTILAAIKNEELIIFGSLLYLSEDPASPKSMLTYDKKKSTKTNKLVDIDFDLANALYALADRMQMPNTFRVDFRTKHDDKRIYGLEDVCFLEINPTPNMTWKSSLGTICQYLKENNNISISQEAFAMAMVCDHLVPNESNS